MQQFHATLRFISDTFLCLVYEPALFLSHYAHKCTKSCDAVGFILFCFVFLFRVLQQIEFYVAMIATMSSSAPVNYQIMLKVNL